MAKMNDTQQLFVVVGASVFLCVAAGFGVWWAEGLVEEERQARQTKNEQIATAQVKIDKIPHTEKEVIILRENLDEYVKILPDSKDLNNFFRIANQFAAQSGVSLRALQPAASGAGKGGSFSRVAYRMELSGTIWQFLKFMNSWESYERFVSVTDLVLTSGAKRNRTASATQEEIRHVVKMTVETYMYRQGGKSGEIAIPNYENKRDNLKEEIFKRRQVIRIDSYEFKGSRGRRDIFVDPRQFHDTGEKPGVPIADQKKLIDRYSGEVEELRNLHSRIHESGVTIFDQYRLEKALREGMKRVQDDISNVDEKGLIKYLPYKLKWTNEVIQPLEDLEAKLVALDTPDGNQRWLTDPEFDELVDSMKQLLNLGDLEMARNRYDAVQSKVDVPRGHPSYGKSVTVKGLYIRALRAIEFSNLTLKIQGVLVNEDGKSGLLLNDEVLEEGDYVNQNLFVKSIGTEQVTFVYKGFTLIKTF